MTDSVPKEEYFSLHAPNWNRNNMTDTTKLATDYLSATPDIIKLLPQHIFNLGKTNFGDTRVLLGELPGLNDSIHRHHQDLFDHYKNLKSLDWDEQEFRFTDCIPEFAEEDDDAMLMIDNTAYQWEGDSIVSNAIPKVVHSTITNSDAMLGYMQIITNEGLHSLSYAEISKLAFSDPLTIMRKILEFGELHQRMAHLGEIFDRARIAAAKYELGQATKEEIMDDVVMFYCALTTLESNQFLASFAITFGFGEMGRFMPVVLAVQKICQDEFEVHIPFNMAILRNIFSFPEGRDSFDRIRPRVVELIKSVHQSEIDWIMHTTKGRQLPPVFDVPGLREFNDYRGTYLARFFEIEKEMPFKLVDKNPLNYMEKWINISKTQTSPQEQENNQYKLNIIDRDDRGLVLPIEF